MSRPLLETPIAEHIWRSKYRYVAPDGRAERSVADTWRRVAGAIAAAETSDREGWARRFEGLLGDFRFLPAGRILAGAGTAWDRTLFNCFVMGVIEDSLDSIFDHLKQAALTMQWGGGIGADFSTLRPAGFPTAHAGGIASGPVSFMKVWDAMCATLLSTGARRGAMMATLRCDHPDVPAFVEAKNEPGVLTNFNVSVQITDAFMHAVERGADWPLCFPDPDAGGLPADERLDRAWTGTEGPAPCRVQARLPARDLWHRIMASAYASAEPGVLFVDTINRGNNLAYCESITATNPCGEIPLPPYGACDLGSINLARFVRSPFETGASMDLDAIRRLVPLAVRFLDDVIDASRFPLPEQAAAARSTRRIGLGVTGLADALAMLGLAYDGEAARGRAREWLTVIRDSAYRSSVALAAEKGAFPLFRRDAYLAGEYIAKLPADIRDGIAADGVRNSHLLAIAPTGTISLLAGNVSSGIEPVFSLEGRRRVLDENGQYLDFPITDYAFARWRDRPEHGTGTPDVFRCARDLAPREHLAMQAALQGLVDNAISKTINVPADIDRTGFQAIYTEAWRLGLKGCTVFRPNPVRGAILSGAAPESVHCCDIEREAD